MREAFHTVYFKLDGVDSQEEFTAISAGDAFAQCKAKYPTCTPIKCIREGHYAGHVGTTEWDYVKVDRPIQKNPRSARAPRRSDKNGVMPFYDSVQKNTEGAR